MKKQHIMQRGIKLEQLPLLDINSCFKPCNKKYISCNKTSQFHFTELCKKEKKQKAF